MKDVGTASDDSATPPRLWKGLLVDSNHIHSRERVDRESLEVELELVVEAYCASSNPFKSLLVRKFAYGWDHIALLKGKS